jgi:hypothetical protein
MSMQSVAKPFLRSATEPLGQPLSERSAIGRTDQNIMARYMSDPLTGETTFNDVVDDRQKIERITVLVENKNPFRCRVPRSITGRVYPVLVVERFPSLKEDLPIALCDRCRGFLGTDLFNRPADDARTGRAEEVLGGAVDHYKLKAVRILHNDQRGNVLDDSVEELARPQNLSFGTLGLCDVHHRDQRRGAPLIIENSIIARNVNYLVIGLTVAPFSTSRVGAVARSCGTLHAPQAARYQESPSRETVRRCSRDERSQRR